MEKATFIYLVYMVFFALLVGAIFITPFLAFSRDMDGVYTAFSYTCHQKMSRSICLFSEGKTYWLGDCLPQSGQFINDPTDRIATSVRIGDITGYKMPVCSRDVGLYLAMLIGGVVYPLVFGLENRKVFPAIFLVVAIVPLGLDGTIQLLSELGMLPFVYESTNMIRLATGAIAGFAAAFYAIPILMNLVCNPPEPARKASGGKKTEEKKTARAEPDKNKDAEKR